MQGPEHEPSPASPEHLQAESPSVSATHQTSQVPPSPDSGNPSSAAARARGIEKMSEVYDLPMNLGGIKGSFMDMTASHLFGEVWSRPGLTIEQRRLLTIGVLATLGRGDLLDIQFRSALKREEFDELALRELVIHLAHYVGWPQATEVNASVERVLRT